MALAASISTDEILEDYPELEVDIESLFFIQPNWR